MSFQASIYLRDRLVQLKDAVFWESFQPFPKQQVWIWVNNGEHIITCPYLKVVCEKAFGRALHLQQLQMYNHQPSQRISSIQSCNQDTGTPCSSHLIFRSGELIVAKLLHSSATKAAARASPKRLTGMPIFTLTRSEHDGKTPCHGNHRTKFV